MCRRVIQGILFIGFSIQIGFGLVWMCGNITKLQDFAGVSTGIYALILRLPGECRPAVYGLQLLAGGYGGYRLMRQLCGGSRLTALWGSLALLTLPMAMQCHLALLPYSLAASAELLQMSFCCQLFQAAAPVRHVAFWQYAELPERKGSSCFRLYAGVTACFLVQMLLLPEYLFFGAAAPLLTFWLRRKDMRREKRLLKAFLFFVLAAAVGAGACAFGRQSMKTNRENDISGLDWTLVKRVCWPTLWVDSEAMPDRVKEAVGDEGIWESAYYPGNMDELFRPAVEAAMDLREAKPLFREMTAQAWKMHSPMVIRQIGWDVLGYCVTPVILQLQLSGDAYDSYSGGNYEIMRNNTPILTKYYVNYGSWWFAAAVILTVVLTIARLAAGEKPCGRKEGLLFITVLLCAAPCVLWYVMQGAGIMDYKYTVWINQLWFVWSLKMMGGRSRDEEERQRRQGSS